LFDVGRAQARSVTPAQPASGEQIVATLAEAVVAHSDARDRQAQQLAPFGQKTPFAAVFDEHVIGTISILLRRRRPSAIPRLVVATLNWMTIERRAERPLAHVCQKGREGR